MQILKSLKDLIGYKKPLKTQKVKRSEVKPPEPIATPVPERKSHNHHFSGSGKEIYDNGGDYADRIGGFEIDPNEVCAEEGCTVTLREAVKFAIQKSEPKIPAE